MLITKTISNTFFFHYNGKFWSITSSVNKPTDITSSVNQPTDITSSVNKPTDITSSVKRFETNWFVFERSFTQIWEFFKNLKLVFNRFAFLIPDQKWKCIKKQSFLAYFFLKKIKYIDKNIANVFNYEMFLAFNWLIDLGDFWTEFFVGFVALFVCRVCCILQKYLFLIRDYVSSVENTPILHFLHLCIYAPVFWNLLCWVLDFFFVF